MIEDRQIITATCDICGEKEELHNVVIPKWSPRVNCWGPPPKWSQIEHLIICPRHILNVVVDGVTILQNIHGKMTWADPKPEPNEEEA